MDAAGISVKNHHHVAEVAAPRNLLIFAAALTGLTFAAEAVGASWTNSVALLSDAGHVFMDFASLLFSLFALRLAERPVSDRRTFGLHRVEVFAAFLNGVLVTGAAAWILFEALHRLKTRPEIKAAPLFFFALGGLAVNLIVAWRLHGFTKKDINIRGAFLHVASDAFASVGVVVGAVLIHFTGKVVLDPIIGIFVGLVIVFNAWGLMRESLHILLEGVPKNIRLPEVVKAIEDISGVSSVEDSHVWSICSHISSFSAQVVLPPEKMADQRYVLDDIHRLLQDRFHIVHSTIQIQSADWRK